MLTAETFDRATIITTGEGKNLISTYLAANIMKITIPIGLTVDIDSELHYTECSCKQKECTCIKYTTPLRVYRGQTQDVQLLSDIQQCKGEAEMAQIDWLIHYRDMLQESEASASIVTSGDIDAVVIHLFALSHLWPRHQQNDCHFQNSVYVILQKPGGNMDIYNITGILSTLEKEWKDRYIGLKIALALSLGGNDFLPKFHGISHLTTVETFLSNPEFRNNLFEIEIVGEQMNVLLASSTYKKVIKYLYCPKRLRPDQYTFDEMRKISILSPSLAEKDIRNPKSWMPPESSIDQLAKNVNCFIRYIRTAGNHTATMPNFLKDGCLRKRDCEVEYDLGPQARVEDIQMFLNFDRETLVEKMCMAKPDRRKRKLENTPQKGRRRKIVPNCSTPRKSQVQAPVEAI